MKDKALFNLQLKYAIFSGLFFLFLYKSAEFYAKSLENIPTIVMEWEKNIPFISIFLIPYMTSGLFFLMIFFLTKDKEDLILLTKRANFITIVSIIIFFIFPLKFSFPKPYIENSIVNFFFYLLKIFDSDFNQCPSLHVSYAFLYMITFYKELNSKIKYFYCFWSFLIAISVLFVYQHHFIDFLGAIIVVFTTFLIFRRKNEK